MTCIAVIEGCEFCEQSRRNTDPDHQCAALCEIRAEIMRESETTHRIWHRSKVHRCGHLLVDAYGNSFDGGPQLCPLGQCTTFFCPRCHRYLYGWGAIGCACCNGRKGHGTRGEFAKRSVRHLVKRGT
jgi:hypothetical protein